MDAPAPIEPEALAQCITDLPFVGSSFVGRFGSRSSMGKRAPRRQRSSNPSRALLPSTARKGRILGNWDDAGLPVTSV